jgi:predicted RecA/RadA family phage recombinase
MKAIYAQQGAALDYTAAEAVPNGAVVSLGTRIGIAAGDIPAGTSGTVHVEGVYRLAKASGEALTVGAAVYYDTAADAVTATAAGNIPAGYAAAPAGANDVSALVKLLG